MKIINCGIIVTWFYSFSNMRIVLVWHKLTLNLFFWLLSTFIALRKVSGNFAFLLSKHFLHSINISWLINFWILILRGPGLINYYIRVPKKSQIIILWWIALLYMVYCIDNNGDMHKDIEWKHTQNINSFMQIQFSI